MERSRTDRLSDGIAWLGVIVVVLVIVVGIIAIVAIHTGFNQAEKRGNTSFARQACLIRLATQPWAAFTDRLDNPGDAAAAERSNVALKEAVRQANHADRICK